MYGISGAIVRLRQAARPDVHKRLRNLVFEGVGMATLVVVNL